jgi:hypothetical protein
VSDSTVKLTRKETPAAPDLRFHPIQIPILQNHDKQVEKLRTSQPVSLGSFRKTRQEGHQG